MKDKPYADSVSLITDSPSWYGCPPAHWVETKIKFLLSERREETSGTLPPGAISFGEVVAKEMINEGTLASYQDVHSGDFVINPINLNYDLKSLRVARSKIDVRVSPAYIVLKNISHTNSRYLRWLLYLFDVAHMKTLGAGVRQTITFSEIGSCVVWLPPLPEQTRIANFLDEQTARIDALIAEKERLDALLGEYRQAVIVQAVTKGLNPDAPMKGSGVEWLGDVPKHWEIRRLKALCDIQTGDKDTVNAVPGGEYPFFVRSQNVERINSYTFDCEAVLTAGDGAGVGKVFHYADGKFDFHQRVYMMNNFRLITGKWFFRYLSALFSKVALDGSAKSTVDSLRMPLFMGFLVTVPPRDEQIAITSFLDQETARIDNLIAHAQAELALLREYRSSLISAAVTGQLDMYGFKAVSHEHHC